MRLTFLKAFYLGAIPFKNISKTISGFAEGKKMKKYVIKSCHVCMGEIIIIIIIFF